MIFAPANTHHYIPANNLSTACKHYTTSTHLCSTTKNTLETSCNLPTAKDLSKRFPGKSAALLAVLARLTYIPLDHTITVGLLYNLARPMPIFPPTNAKPQFALRPNINLWPTNAEPLTFQETLPQKTRHQSWLNHYEPFMRILWPKC